MVSVIVFIKDLSQIATNKSIAISEGRIKIRLTANEQDKLAWVPWDLSDIIVVHLDGAILNYVEMADDEEGYAIVHNEKGIPEVLTGKVEFVPIDERGERLLVALRKRWEILAPQRGSPC